MPYLHATAEFTWRWSLHPDVLVLCAALLGTYWYAATIRPHISDARRVRGGQAAAYVLGVGVIYLSSGWPLHELSEGYLVSAHMMQHVLLTMAAPPLLLAGIPAWMWQAVLRLPGALRAGRLLTHPLVAFSAFNAAMLLLHLPSAVELQVKSEWFHLLAHTALTGSALLMWWPVLSTVPELPRLSPPLQMGYLFVQSIVPAVLAAVMTFSSSPIYGVYANSPRVWGISPLEDQQIGAGIMKLLGSLIMWSFIAFAFFKWYAREEAEARGPRWTEVEEELHQMRL